jgi:hypothetical protein
VLRTLFPTGNTVFYKYLGALHPFSRAIDNHLSQAAAPRNTCLAADRFVAAGTIQHSERCSAPKHYKITEISNLPCHKKY